jgi:hypothetical protein
MSAAPGSPEQDRAPSAGSDDTNGSAWRSI